MFKFVKEHTVFVPDYFFFLLVLQEKLESLTSCALTIAISQNSHLQQRVLP